MTTSKPPPRFDLPTLDPWLLTSEGFTFTWDLAQDRATLIRSEDGATVWKGSLLPTLKVIGESGEAEFVKARATNVTGDCQRQIGLEFPGLGAGVLEAEATEFGLALRNLTWEGSATKTLQGLFFGGSVLTDREKRAAPFQGATFWPDWRAEGFCVPGAKCNPGQSFWRSWDMGNAILPLGSFGPAMGTPYTAAFPRPLLAAAMGGDAGWMVFGPGEVPTAAVSLDIQSASGWLRYWMREDLWGGPGGQRDWNEPLRLSWHREAWEGFARLFDSFPVPATAPSHSQRSQWGTWQSFKVHNFDVDKETDRARRYGVAELQIDDQWETWNSSGVVHPERLPRFSEQLENARQHRLEIDLWQSIGWVDEPEAAGLTKDDLLCGLDGEPILTHWGCDPRTEQPFHYALDPSSEGARRFLIERTRHTLTTYRPKLLKLDFGYGMPGPDGTAPRNPAFRGERLNFELLRLITDTAREVDPGIAIEYYGIHPLLRPLYDVLSLDDLGDMGPHEMAGHQQRTVWAALAARQGAAIMASSGYYWSAFSDMLLNASILGAPGACLPPIDVEGHSETPSLVSRFRAVSRWHRRRVGWHPLWLNSSKGNLGTEPTLACWGRLEDDSLTALALRECQSPPDLKRWGLSSWSGTWALIAQDDRDLSQSRSIACIPFGEGELVFSHSSSHKLQRWEWDGAFDSSTSKTASLRVHTSDLDFLEGILIQR